MEASASRDFIFPVINTLRLHSIWPRKLKQEWAFGKEEMDWRITTGFFDYRGNLLLS